MLFREGTCPRRYLAGLFRRFQHRSCSLFHVTRRRLERLHQFSDLGVECPGHLRGSCLSRGVGPSVDLILLDTEAGILDRGLLENLDSSRHGPKLVPPRRVWDLGAGIASCQMPHGDCKGDDWFDDVPADFEQSQKADQNGREDQQNLVQEMSPCVDRYSFSSRLCQINSGIGHPYEAVERRIRLLYPGPACSSRVLARAE